MRKNPETIPDDGKSPEALAEEKDLREKIMAFLTKILESNERLIIVLHYYEGESLQDISRILNIPENQVNEILGEVLKRMRPAVE